MIDLELGNVGSEVEQRAQQTRRLGVLDRIVLGQRDHVREVGQAERRGEAVSVGQLQRSRPDISGAGPVRIRASAPR